LAWLRILALLGGAVFILSWLVAWYWTKDAQWIQLIQPADPGASVLFGDPSPGTPLGKADYYMISDPQAFLEGKSEEGALLVSQSYLESHRLYPLQRRTVWFIQSWVAWISALGTLILVGLWFFFRARVSQTPQTPQAP
jgi:hypothetical protein